MINKYIYKKTFGSASSSLQKVHLHAHFHSHMDPPPPILTFKGNVKLLSWLQHDREAEDLYNSLEGLTRAL